MLSWPEVTRRRKLHPVACVGWKDVRILPDKVMPAGDCRSEDSIDESRRWGLLPQGNAHGRYPRWRWPASGMH